MDIDVGNRKVGIINKGNNDAFVNDYMTEYEIGRIEEQAVPLIINFFNKLEIPITFAVRGQLLSLDTRIINYIFNSNVMHEIGSHSYFHRDFTKLSYDEADKDLRLVANIMNKFNIIPKSFIFPKNRVAHLDLIEKYGYSCYRDYGDFIRDGRYIKKNSGLYDVHPGLYIGNITNLFLIKKIIDLSIKDKVFLHMWFHPWNLGNQKKLIQRNIRELFTPLFSYIKKKENKGEVTFETMNSVCERMEAIKKI